MKSTFGNSLTMSLFGESHGPGIGIVLDGLAPGLPLDLAHIRLRLAQRRGEASLSTTRREADEFELLSGFFEGHTTGAPLAILIRNGDAHSKDYGQLKAKPRPSHADYTAFCKYHGFQDYRGGGHFSGRLTAPLTFAGAIFRQILLRRGVHIGAHAAEIGGVSDACFDPVHVENHLLDTLAGTYFPLVDPTRESAMRDVIEQARMQQDSVGAVSYTHLPSDAP